MARLPYTLRLISSAFVISLALGITLGAVMARDFNLLPSILRLSSFLVIIVNVLIDLLHAWLAERIEAT